VKVPERSGAQAECLCHDAESTSCRSPWHGLQSVRDFYDRLPGYDVPPRGKLGAGSGSLRKPYALTKVVSPLRLRSRSWQVRSVSARASRLGTP
jgi:hypothetical protein